MYIIFPEDGASPIPSILTFSVAGGTLIWSCVLLATNNRPSSSHRLCTALAHAIALCISAVVWLGAAIAMSTTLPFACSYDAGTISSGEFGKI
ncbi:hypothetical protein K474DRAFT_1709493 [Panus rudis PR-1116 ss-1]|nr:hypothetical protein K474DRAFT_1709493 [Panus rudis PR-1116 ss-1]